MTLANTFALKGNILYSDSPTEIRALAKGYLVCCDGKSAGVFQELPKIYEGIQVTDYGDSLIIPGLTDLHLHAPQYAFRGFGMDLELLEWLNAYTFPEEAKYSDLDYARKAYEIFCGDLCKTATTRACVFGTIHTEATLLLMELLEKTGIKACVGKVNMDRNSPENLIEESAEASLSATKRWLMECEKANFKNVKPIITPRFTPSCTDELMEGLGTLAKENSLAVQSHLSENLGEILWVKELCPDCINYAESYLRHGLFGGEIPTIMAHCVHCTYEELESMKANKVFVAHCPQSNINVASGIAPVRRQLDMGINVGLGSDVAGGASLSILRAMSDAVGVSKLYWRLVDDSQKPLTIAEAFYLGTKGGGAFFGKVGSFAEGYELDAVVIDDSMLESPRELTLLQRLERYIHLGSGAVTAKYIEGEKE